MSKLFKNSRKYNMASPFLRNYGQRNLKDIDEIQTHKIIKDKTFKDLNKVLNKIDKIFSVKKS